MTVAPLVTRHLWMQVPLLIGSVATGTTASLAADLPRTAIDVGMKVECRDVTPPEFAAANHDHMIVEAHFHLSVLVQSGRETDLEQLQVHVESLPRRLHVVDFQPRTELASELAGDVEVCATADTVQSLNASLGTVVGGEYGPTHVQATPTAGVGVTQNRGTKEMYHRLSPKQVVLASGTTHAEQGVFFKWRRSTQATLEGAREVSCRYIVPKSWRGDWVQVSCNVHARHRSYFAEKIEPCGQSQVFVALYLAGDGAAQQAATELVRVQQPVEVASYTATADKRHVAYKPVTDPSASNAWFGLPTLLKPCNHARETNASTAADLPAALESLGSLSGYSAVSR